MSLRVVSAQDVAGKRVVCRLDADVPLKQESNGTQIITDTYRIDAAIPTIQFLTQSGATHVTVLAHLGRPKGHDASLSLEPVAHYLADHLGAGATPITKTVVNEFDAFDINPTVTLLENIRFNGGEEENDPALAKRYAALGEFFVFDAFAVSHRSQASTLGVMSLLPNAAGLVVQREEQFLDRLKNSPKTPFVIIIGGIKIEDKLPIISALADLGDKFLIGGGVANTFLKSQGLDIGDSLAEDAFLDQARQILNQLGDKICLPQDYIKEGTAIRDIGPRTIMQFEDILTDAATVFWNGCLGQTEVRNFSRGTAAIGDFVARQTGQTRVVAGGDTVGFLDSHHLAQSMSFISTGGGATLDYLAGKPMPVLEALSK